MGPSRPTLPPQPMVMALAKAFIHHDPRPDGPSSDDHCLHDLGHPVALSLSGEEVNDGADDCPPDGRSQELVVPGEGPGELKQVEPWPKEEGLE